MTLPVGGTRNATQYHEKNEKLDEADVRPRWPPRILIFLLIVLCGRRRRYFGAGLDRRGLRNLSLLGRVETFGDIWRRFGGHRLVGCLRRTFGFGGGAAEPLSFGDGFTKIAQAPVAERRRLNDLRPRLGLRLRRVGAWALGRLRLDLADRFLKTQPFARNVGLVERRLNSA